MADIFESKVRSYTMSRIKKVNTKPEILVRQFLFKHGFRFRIHVKTLPGNPDIVLRKYSTAVFVNGCFWHAHEGCKYNRLPKSRTEYWVPKIMGNAKRDFENLNRLQDLQWRVITIWECELGKLNAKTTLLNLIKQLSKTLPTRFETLD